MVSHPLLDNPFMRELTEGDIAAAPLPPGQVSDAWGSYLAFWRQGIRSDALAAANRFVDSLKHSGADTSAEFARWLCVLLFDESDFWAGQWGGGLTRGKNGWHRPMAPVLTVHPLSVRVTLPYLLSSLPTPDRWNVTSMRRSRLVSSVRGSARP